MTMPQSAAPARDLDALLAEVRAFVEAECYPLERAFAEGRSFAALEPALEAVREKVRARGWWLPQLPAEAGGMGLGLEAFGRLGEELGRSFFGHYAFNCQAPDAGTLELLLEHASPAQRATYLEPLLEGRVRSCFAMTEPNNPGSNPVQLGTRARRQDDGSWVLDGRKWFSTGADGAAFTVVMAVTDPGGHPYGRASLFLVPAGAEGFEHVRRIPVMGEAGDGWMSHSELRFKGCRLPAEQLLGAEGAGFAMAQERLGPGRIHHAMRWIGIAERAFDLMCARAGERELAPGKPLGSRQFVLGWIAESRAEIDAARLLVLDCARLIEREGGYAARHRVSLIKFHAAGMLQRVLDRAIQTHGALGLTDETPLAFWYRHERAARIYDGPDEVHLDRLGRAILKGRSRGTEG